MSKEEVFMEKWDPMQDAYKNEKFNNYDSGPAASMTIQQIRPYLVLKNPPKYLTNKGVLNLCNQHGRVTNVRYCKKTEYYFVDMATVSDMEAVFRALSNNLYGFEIMIGKGKDRHEEVALKEKQPVQISTNSGHQNNAMESQNRLFIPKHRQFERPQISDKAIITANDYANNSLLELNDPQHHFLIERDAHELERAGLLPQKTHPSENSMYRTGRAFTKISDETRKFLAEKNLQSTGVYIPAQRSYIYNGGKAIKNVGECEECQLVTDVVCARCCTFYCGIECQKRNWPKHRTICGRPKELNPTNFSNPKQVVEKPCEKLPPPKMQTKITEVQMPPSGSEVCITSFSKSNVLFIRSASNENDVSFFKMLSAVNAAATTNILKRLEATPKLGQIVITKFEEQYNRAMVLNVESIERIKLVAIDYGNIDVKRFDDLFEVTEQLMQFPRMAIPIILKDVPDIVLTDDIRDLMNNFLHCTNLKVIYQKEDFVKEKGVYFVELFDDFTGKSLNQALVTKSKPTEPANEDFYHRDYLKRFPLPTGKSVTLVVMDNSLLTIGFIACATKEHAVDIQNTQEAVKLYAESLEQKNYTPRVEELCIAKYSADKKWYRGICLEIFGNGYPTIAFCDYGNVDRVNIADIRRYPKQLNYPIYTCDCEIKGLPENCNKQQVEKLEELIPIGSSIVCDLVETCEEQYSFVITLDGVIEQLKQEKLL